MGIQSSFWFLFSMRAYLITTGTVFGLITLAHLLRMIFEGRERATDPAYILLRPQPLENTNSVLNREKTPTIGCGSIW